VGFGPWHRRRARRNDAPPTRTITRAVDRLGPARARALLGQALTVEAQGGLTLPDGHRRTPGGVFFHLVRTSDAISWENKDYNGTGFDLISFDDQNR